MSNPTPEQMRAAARVDMSTALRGSLDEHDIDQCELAEVCGVKASQVQRWVDKKRPDSPLAADMFQAFRPIAMDYAKRLGETHHFIVVDRLEVDSSKGHMEHLGAIMSAVGQASSEYLDMIADQILTPAEQRRSLASLRLLRDRAEAAIQCLESTQRDVVGVRLHSVDGGAA